MVNWQRVLLLLVLGTVFEIGYYLLYLSPKDYRVFGSDYIISRVPDTQDDLERRTRQINASQQSSWDNTTKTADITTNASTPSPCGKSLPSAILIGGQRTGASAISKFLVSLNKHIKGPIQETHFFDSENYIRGFSYYQDLMPESCPGDVVIDLNPGYFSSPLVLDRMYQWKPNLKLLLALREPVTRALSEYLSETALNSSDNQPSAPVHHTFQELARGNQTHPIKETFLPVQHSLYDVSLDRWLHLYPLHQFHIVDSDNFIRHPVAELKAIEAFLGLKSEIDNSMFVFNSSTGYYCLHQRQCGHTVGHSHHTPDAHFLQQMVAFFKPHMIKLHQLIGQKLSWMDNYL